MKKLGVLIGRFQPFHWGHDSLLQEALRHCDEVLILIGSSQRARSIKNPWTFQERCTMIRTAYPEQTLHFAAIPDYFYDEAAWFQAIHQAVQQAFPDAQPLLVGHSKDASSYYLQHFPDWETRECPDFKHINATAIRQAFLLQQEIPHALLPPAVADFLQQFMHTPLYTHLREEALFIQAYRQSWTSAPYPPIFATVDAVVICAHHILLIERGQAPGKGLLALPGGFLEANEWTHAGLMRELKEETCIALTDSRLQQALQDIVLYDYPERSNIGRVITHAGLFILDEEVCPAVTAQDDAKRAAWYPLDQLAALQDQFHDDHYQIIRHLLARSGILTWS